MQLLDEQNLEPFLRERGWIDSREQVVVSMLAGGVSNQVLLVRRAPEEASFVVKQARPQLRVADPWFCSVERIAREISVIDICTRLLLQACTEQVSGASVPKILFVDRENYCFAMTAAPAGSAVWKAMLLAGQVDPSIARTAANLLGILHAEGWHDPLIAEEVGDRQFFIELRLDPYYRQLSRLFPPEAPRLESLIEQVLENRHTLVHADFSPKNLLVSDASLMLVDFETGHFGDPAFDIGFFLAHLLLKAVYHAPRSADYLSLASIFWNQYVSVIQPCVPADEIAALERRTVMNMAACLWARLDGKSKIDYLTETPRRDLVRRLARAWLYEPSALRESFSQIETAASQLPSRT